MKKYFLTESVKATQVFIDYAGKGIKSVKGKEAERLIARIQQTETDKDVQLALAKITGNFKRGNEKDNKK